MAFGSAAFSAARLVYLWSLASNFQSSQRNQLADQLRRVPANSESVSDLASERGELRFSVRAILLLTA